MNSEYFWWLAALALVAAGGVVAVLSWRPAAQDAEDALDADDGTGVDTWPAGPADA